MNDKTTPAPAPGAGVNSGNPAVKTRIATTGTMADLHAEAIGYDLETLARLVTNLAPALLCLEVTRAAWEGGEVGRAALPIRAALAPVAEHSDMVIIPVAASPRDHADFTPVTGGHSALARSVPQSARRLLDVGGGHGLYSIRFCRRYPALSATVFDLPLAIEVARETIAAEGMGGRVTAQAGDVWLDDLGAGYDVALLFNLIHAYLPDKNVELLRKVAGALNRGGLIVVMEQLAGKVFGSTATVLARLQALNFFNDLEAQTYTFEEITGWLTQAGFVHPRRMNLLKTPGFGLALGTKTG